MAAGIKILFFSTDFFRTKIFNHKIVISNLVNNISNAFYYEYKNNDKYKGKLYKIGNLEFEGEFKNDKKWNGKGYDKNGQLIYQLKNGHGKIKEYNDDGKLVFEGEYSNGERNGKGKEYNYNGLLKFEGNYIDGKRNGYGKEYDDNYLIFEGIYFNDKKWEGKGYNILKNFVYQLKGGRGSIKEYNKGELLWKKFMQI